MIPDKNVWVFCSSKVRFPGGVFSTLELAETWIKENHLSGLLTAHPVDEGCFDWAMRMNLITGRARDRKDDPNFVGSFTTASQEHFHYDSGERV